MPTAELLTIALSISLVALLYSSVGHGGASGYIAIMTLFGFPSTEIRPTALVLNLLVSSVGFFQFWRAGHFSWRQLWPFVVLSIPMSFLGGSLQLPTAIINPLLGMVLLFSVVRLCFPIPEPTDPSPPAIPIALGVGACIGFLSGITGTGGGIFLTPLLLILGWMRTKQAAAISVAFILVNSLAGLSGYLSVGKSIPSIAWWLALAALAGGSCGSYLGSHKLPIRAIQLLLMLVLVIAGQKLLLTR